MTIDTLGKYIGLFGNLHRNKNPKYGMAPHKPVLLLAVLSEIERGSIPQNFIKLTPELVAAFRAYWRALVPPDTWLEKIANPFRFLAQDNFWKLVKDDIPTSIQSLGYNPTIKQLTTEVEGAILAPDLWQLLQDQNAIHALRTFLLKEYFGVSLVEVQPQIPDSPIDYEAEKLKAEAQSKFRVRMIGESKDETGYYIRHTLFPKVVKSLYNNACAVCAITVYIEEGRGLVDAAHIMPFTLFHNDDPRNGIALCKNHHWGFDAGWYTLSDEYTIIVSSHLRNVSTYITTGCSITLPAQSQYAPARAALEWHRANVYMK